MKAIFDSDLLVRAGSLIDGHEIPAALASLPFDRLRWSGAEIIDAAGVTAWHIDANGRKRLGAADGRQPLTCAWDAVLVHDGTAWRVRTAADDLIVYAHAAQWTRAEAGLSIAFAGGPTVRFPTDGTGRGLLNGAVARAQQPSPPSGFRWQTGATSFVTLTPAQVIEAGIAVADYVQATFDTLEAVLADILSGTITSTAQIDAAQWPSN